MQTMMLRPRVMRARCPAMRSTPDNKAAVTSAVDVPPSEAKMKSTLSSLDALLGTDSVKEAAASRPQEAPRAPVASTSYTPTPTPSAAQTQQSWQTTATPAKKQIKNFNFDEIMGFDGLAPEIINGRAAMLGFIAAMMGELSTGESVFSQLVAGGGLKMLAIIGVVLVASFAPAVRKMPFDEMFGKDKHPLIFGPFNPNAEVRNGRAAMLGLLALFFIEGTSSQGFFM